MFGFRDNQQAGIRITKFLLHETGTYNTQYRRPYNTHLDGSTLNILQERLFGAEKYAPTLMAGVANQFISPMATPEKQITIANGWGERRMRFMMEVEHNYYTGGKVILVVLGYTNYNGISRSGNVDPNMEFYVNSIMQVRETVTNTPVGNQVYTNVFDSSHILVDNNWSGVYSSDHEHRMRPEDVFATVSRSHLNAEGTLVDGRAINNDMAVKSRRSNGLAASYMTNILNNYRTAALTAEFGNGEQEILSSARGSAAEHIASKDPFLQAVSHIRGMPVGNTFTFGDLRALDPNIDNVTVAQIMMPTEKVAVHQMGQTADWGGSDRDTMVATILSQSIPGLLMELALTRIVFMATNRDFSGTTNVTIIDANGFSSGDQTTALQIFSKRVELEILRDISFDNQTDFAVEMQVDLLGETWIRLSLDGKAPIDFVTPSFCDALTVPVLTANNDLSMTLATDFEQLTHALVVDNASSPLSGFGSATAFNTQGSNKSLFGKL